MKDEQESSIQKKLSFSIDTILDKPEPLFLKIKHHHLLIDETKSNNSKQLHLIHADDDRHGTSSSNCSAISTSDDEDEEENYSEDGILNQYSQQDIIHRKKKTRTVFSRSQIYQLETTFDRKRYLSSADRANLAQDLRLTEQQVKVKIQNLLRIIDLLFLYLDLVSKSKK